MFLWYHGRKKKKTHANLNGSGLNEFCIWNASKSYFKWLRNKQQSHQCTVYILDSHYTPLILIGIFSCHFQYIVAKLWFCYCSWLWVSVHFGFGLILLEDYTRSRCVAQVLRIRIFIVSYYGLLCQVIWINIYIWWCSLLGSLCARLQHPHIKWHQKNVVLFEMWFLYGTKNEMRNWQEKDLHT